MDKIVEHHIGMALSAVALGKHETAREHWFQAVAHYAAAGAIVGATFSLEEFGVGLSSEQHRNLLAILEMIGEGTYLIKKAALDRGDYREEDISTACGWIRDLGTGE